MKKTKFSQKVSENLGYYVYLYINPLTNKVFYIGRGKDNRAFDHLRDTKESRKVKMIRKIYSRVKEGPRIEILVHNLPNENAAIRVEAAAIDLIGIHKLTNEVRGQHSAIEGRMSLEQVKILYDSDEAEVEVPAILIRVNKLYRYDMTVTELYEATRGIWKIGQRRYKVQYAFAIYRGIVREVYRIKSWHKAGTTKYKTRPRNDTNTSGRWEFKGEIANDIRKQYVDKSVAKYFPNNSQNPIKYVFPIK